MGGAQAAGDRRGNVLCGLSQKSPVLILRATVLTTANSHVVPGASESPFISEGLPWLLESLSLFPLTNIPIKGSARSWSSHNSAQPHLCWMAFKDACTGIQDWVPWFLTLYVGRGSPHTPHNSKHPAQTYFVLRMYVWTSVSKHTRFCRYPCMYGRARVFARTRTHLYVNAYAVNSSSRPNSFILCPPV